MSRVSGCGSASLDAGRWTKMLYLIRRRPTTSREELVAHWFGSHMPAVILDQRRRALSDRSYARRYLVTLYDPDERGEHPWDGMAQLWWESPQPRPNAPHGTTPLDAFQQKVEPYMPWICREYVVMDGAANLAAESLTQNPLFPRTRSGYYKASYLVRARPGTDFDAFYAHWLNIHRPNVRSIMEQTGGFRYVLSLSTDPQGEPYAAMSELYFHDKAAWHAFNATIKPDGLERWIQRTGSLALGAVTEMIDIP